MRIVSISLCLTALLAINVPLTGCGDKTAEPKKDKDASAALSHDGHDHCDHDATHQHSCEGPHGGHLIELGDKAYQAKLLRDEKTNTVTVHLLDATGEKRLPPPRQKSLCSCFATGSSSNTCSRRPQSKTPRKKARPRSSRSSTRSWSIRLTTTRKPKAACK